MFLQSFDASRWVSTGGEEVPGARWTAPALHPRTGDGTPQNGCWLKERTRT